jgi:hypothetical protein
MSQKNTPEAFSGAGEQSLGACETEGEAPAFFVPASTFSNGGPALDMLVVLSEVNPYLYADGTVLINGNSTNNTNATESYAQEWGISGTLDISFATPDHSEYEVKDIPEPIVFTIQHAPIDLVTAATFETDDATNGTTANATNGTTANAMTRVVICRS